MILGIGSDLANIERIGGTIERFGARFLDRVYTDTEQRLAERRRTRVETYAKRWAAKEACSKALGTGLRMGIKWKDMGVVNLETGQPTLTLTGWAAERLAAMTPRRAPRPHSSDPDGRSSMGDGRGDDRGAPGRALRPRGREGRPATP